MKRILSSEQAEELEQMRDEQKQELNALIAKRKAQKNN
jgi:hypothetical protein